jgi:hypothetical protein
MLRNAVNVIELQIPDAVILVMIENRLRHIFQTFWWGNVLSPYEVLCLKSFVDHGHNVHLYTFDSQLKVPDGVLICDAAKLISQDRFFTYKEGQGNGSPAGFSNLFRYRLLMEKGGWWIDTDVVCLSSRIPTVSQFFAYEDDDLVNSAVLFFETNHPAMLRCHARAEQLGSSVQWGDTGPPLLTKVLRELGYIDQARPAAACYPVHYSDALDPMRPSQAPAIVERVKHSFFLHLWNEQLRRDGINKKLLPPQGSVLRQLVELHQVSGWMGEYESRTLEYLDLKAKLAMCKERLAVCKAELAGYKAESWECKAGLAECKAELAGCKGELAACYIEIERQETKIDSILSSTSWRLTVPLRSVAKLIRSWRS